MERGNNSEGPSWIDEAYENEMFEGLEELSVEMEENIPCDSNEEDECINSEMEIGCEETCSEDDVQFDIEKGATIANMHDILSLDLRILTPNDLGNVMFASLEMAYEFYHRFAKVNGFAARKGKVLKSKKGEILQQTFVCYRQGFREDRGLTRETRKREIKPETRCGCEAKLRVHIDIYSSHWYITYFLDDHNHDLLEDQYCRMVAAHRKMSEADVMRMNKMRKVGIGTPQIYGSFADQCGGYDRIGFSRKDVYNQVGRQRKLQNLDARSAIHYLRGLRETDPLMFFRHTVCDDNRLQHLFWCDGIMKMDYKIFGDVLAFDATYGKNKYQCPLVIFSGVNHHNQTTVFACAIVADETEETYVWVLGQFLEAMKGKSPVSVITDGDLAMKNAIRRMFPNAHHRLCAWHLIRNATTKIGIPAFTVQFRKCMLGDCDIGEFRRRWREMISSFGLDNHPWVMELYEKRKMWCTAYMRGNFFAGFRTTSRCEGLHSEIKKFIHSRYNLTEFLQHFHRCLNFMRYREVESDFASIHGEPVLQTHFQSLERFAVKVYTREIFHLFRTVLDKSSSLNVVGCKQSFSYYTYMVSNYEMAQRVWYVSYHPLKVEFRCSCQRMESFGIPCGHLLAVLVYLRFFELPECLILKRWTKVAKDEIRDCVSSVSNFWDSGRDARYLSLMEYYRDVSVLASASFDVYDEEREKAINECDYLKSKRESPIEDSSERLQAEVEGLRDPSTARTKGSRLRGCTSAGGTKSKRSIKCGACKQAGHNRRSCPTGIRQPIEEDDDISFNDEDSNADLEQEFSTFEGPLDGACSSFQASRGFDSFM